MKKIFFILILILPFIIQAQIYTPIYNFEPECESSVRIPIEQNKSYEIDDNDIGIEEPHTDEQNQIILQKYVLKSLVDTQLQAQGYDADGIIINNIISFHVNRDINISGELGIPFVRKVNEFRIVVSAELVKICEGNKKFSNVSTPYNSKGEQVGTDIVKVEFTVKGKDSIVDENDHIPPASNVSIEGAYSVNIGESSTQLANLGQESARLKLIDGSLAYGYGRNLWYIVESDIVTHILQNVDILNNHGKNHILYSDNYDAKNWIINDGISFKDTYESISKKLELKEKNDRFYIKGDRSILYFTFEDYFSYDSHTTIKKLNGFTLSSIASSQFDKRIKFAQVSDLELKNVLNLSTREVRDNFQNFIYLNEKGPWSIINQNVMFNVDAGKVNKIKVTEAVSGNQSEQEFVNILNKFNIPLSKKEFLTRYPDISDEFDALSLTNEVYTLQAYFDSYEDDAQLIEMNIEYLE